MSIFKKLFGSEAKPDLRKIIEDGAFLVDVRSAGEFAGAHVSGSVNIPLDSIASHLSKFKGKKDIIVFCLSGNRSRQAKSLLEQNGFTNIINGGSWQNVSKFTK